MKKRWRRKISFNSTQWEEACTPGNSGLCPTSLIGKPAKALVCKSHSSVCARRITKLETRKPHARSPPQGGYSPGSAINGTIFSGNPQDLAFKVEVATT